MGLAGFGIGLVGLAFLPYVMPAPTAIVLLTIYSTVFALVVFVQLRQDVDVRGVVGLFVGSVVGTPLGVWVLATLPVTALNRLIGLMLVVVVVLEFLGLFPDHLRGRGWGLGTGVVAGVLGAAVGTPGPPVVIYMASQGWSPRTIKANLQLFFVSNQAVTLAGYWWAGLLTMEVLRLGVSFAVPAALGAGVGIALFDRVDPVRFRRLVFVLLLVSGVVLLARG